MSKLYIFGDSYSAPDFCVEPKDSWWGIMARELPIDTIENYSWPGNNVDSIAHLVASGPGFAPNDYIVIGVPPIERFTVFNADSSARQYYRFFKNLVKIDQPFIPQHDGLEQVTTHQLGREYVMSWNRSWQEAQVLRELFLLGQYIQGWTNNYLIVNLAEPFQPATQWAPLSSMQFKFLANPHAILFSDTYYSINKDINKPVDFDTHGWHGHHGAAGNQRWWELVLKPRIKQLGWI